MGNEKKGYFYVILSAAIFGCMPLMAKYIYAGGGNAISLVFYRSFLALPALYFLSGKERTKIEEMPLTYTEMRKIVVLVVFGLGITPVFLFSSYNLLASGMATTIHFIYPVLVVLGCVIFCHKALTPVKLVCVVLCTAGITCLCDLKGGASIPGLLLAFFSGVTYAFYIIYLEQSGLKSMPHFRLGFHCAWLTSVLMSVYALAVGSFTVQMSPAAWLLSFLFANLVTVGGVVLFQRGVELTGPQTASILSTFEPLTSIAVGILFLREGLHGRTVTGAILILISVIVLTILSRSDK